MGLDPLGVLLHSEVFEAFLDALKLVLHHLGMRFVCDTDTADLVAAKHCFEGHWAY